MMLVIAPTGCICSLYAEMIDLRALGSMAITRASHVEPDADGQWFADLSPVGGPTLGPFATRSAALAAEADWLEAHVLISPVH